MEVFCQIALTMVLLGPCLFVMEPWTLLYLMQTLPMVHEWDLVAEVDLFALGPMVKNMIYLLYFQNSSFLAVLFFVIKTLIEI